MELVAQKRSLFGKKAKTLTKSNQLPAVMFGKGIESVSLSVPLAEFSKLYKTVGDTNILDLLIDGVKNSVLVKELKYHPVSNALQHVSFYKVNLKEKLRADIPVVVINDKQNPVVKSGEGLILILLDEITVEALPTDLPDRFEVDASALLLGQVVHVKDLGYDRSKVEIVDSEPNEIVVKLEAAGQKEVVEATAGEDAEKDALEKLQATSEKPATDEDAEADSE